jgi:hypothetical protein
MDLGKEIFETGDCKLLMDALQFVDISRHGRIKKNRGVLKLRFQ